MRSLTLGDMSKLTPIDTARERLRDWIKQGQLAPGKRLPSERALGTRLGVSRTVVRSVLLDLERDRLVCRSARRGWMVATPTANGNGAATFLGQTVAILVEGALTRQPAHREPGWSDYIHAGVADAILGHGISALTVPAKQLAEGGFTRLLQTPPRGFIVLDDPTAMSQTDLVRTLRQAAVPLVAQADLRPWPGCDTVISDQEGGCHAVTRWLIERGCRRLLRFNMPYPDPPDWFRRRMAGCERACREAGIPSLPPLAVHGDPAYDRAGFDRNVRLTAGYLYEHLHGANAADAIMVLSDGAVPGVTAACRLLGKVPQQDVAIVGYDNYWRECPELAYELTPPMATVDKDNRGIGRALVELLLARLAGQLPPAPQCRIVPSHLIVTEKGGSSQ